MAGKTRIARWWDMLRQSYCKRLGIPAKKYADLSRDEQAIVYHYWTTGKV